MDMTKGDVIVDDDDSVPAQLIAKFADQGIEIHLKDLTSDIGIPTIGAAATTSAPRTRRCSPSVSGRTSTPR